MNSKLFPHMAPHWLTTHWPIKQDLSNGSDFGSELDWYNQTMESMGKPERLLWYTAHWIEEIIDWCMKTIHTSSSLLTTLQDYAPQLKWRYNKERQLIILAMDTCHNWVPLSYGQLSHNIIYSTSIHRINCTMGDMLGVYYEYFGNVLLFYNETVL